MNQKTYDVTVHTYPPRMKMILGPFVNKFGIYLPSKDLTNNVSYMMQNKMPRLIGSVSERMSIELIDGGQIHLGRELWHLTSISFLEFENSKRIHLLPDFGIYSDDIITIASKDKNKMIFVTESKGTTLKRGFSRNTQAKMWYQLPRTAKNCRAIEFQDPHSKVGGIISVLINHYSNSILINVVDMSTSLAKELPDSWMYPQN